MEFEDYDDAIESYENENYFDNDVEEPPEDLFLEETETNQKDDLDKNKGEDGQKLLETVWQKSEDDAKKSKRGGTRPKLTERDLLDGQKGIPALRERFDKLGFGPRDGPYEKLNMVLTEMEYWAHNLHPPLNFDDFLARVENLGKKRVLKHAMRKIRIGMDLDEPDESKNIVATDTEDQPKLTEEGTKTARPNQRSPTKSETDDDARPFDDENFWNEPLPAVEGQEKADEPLATIFVQNSVESDPDEGEFEWVPTTTVEQPSEKRRKRIASTSSEEES